MAFKNFPQVSHFPREIWFQSRSFAGNEKCGKIPTLNTAKTVEMAETVEMAKMAKKAKTARTI